MKLTIATTLAALALAASAPLFAAGNAADNVTMSDPYVRMVPPGQMVTGAFAVLKNADDKEHKVVKADSPAAKVTELHTHVHEGGMMKMRMVKDIEIKAKGETALQPGGLHIMLIDLKKPLSEGENVAITLTFEDGSSKTFDAQVRKPQAMMPQAKFSPDQLLRAASFRKTMKIGDETNCGPILEFKGPLVKVYFPVSNYGNEHWIRTEQIFPAGYGCRFLNGQYVLPPI